MNEVARLLGIRTAETVRKWVRQTQVDASQRQGAETDESAELKRLRRENAELKRANGILKAASTFFATELGRGPLARRHQGTGPSLPTKVPVGPCGPTVAIRTRISAPS